MREEYCEGFFRFRNAIWDCINLRNDKQSWLDGWFRVDIATFDEPVVREAILNAVCHREYRLGGSIFVRQYSRRLEIVSPGGFPSGVTPHNILHRQNPRNRRLAESFARCGLVERAGQGMDLMFERALRDSKPPPDFNGSDEHHVFLTLEGTLDQAFIKFLTKLTRSGVHLTAHDLIVLDMVRREQPVPRAFTRRVAYLVGRGIIDSTGRGRGVRYILGPISGDAKSPETLLSGNAKIRESLSGHLANRMQAGCSFSELQSLVPKLSRRTLLRLLQDLRAAGRVHLVGAGRGARWFASHEMRHK